MKGKRVLVALGGNAILQRGQRGAGEEQMTNVRTTSRQIVRMIEAGYEVVVTHGNGPQIGALMIQHELGSQKVPAMTMDICGAESQGFIGYMLQQSIFNELAIKNIHRKVACIVTQVEVDPDDQAFRKPTKPVGPFYTAEQAKIRMAATGETWIDDSGRGWRRVVPSPDPKRIVERDIIKHLVDSGYVIIASGGGGIPVLKNENGQLKGTEAVIDKDLAGERLAEDVKADILMILTDVPNVALNYKQPDQKILGNVTLEEMRLHQRNGHFKAGSMGPKVEAIIRFVQYGGERGIIASLDQALDSLNDNAGTVIRS